MAGLGVAMEEFATVGELGRLLRRGEISPVEIVDALIPRIEAAEPRLHCFVTFTPEVALDRAREAQQRLRSGASVTGMTGIPYGLKDVIGTAGILTTGQSRILIDNVPTRDAFVESSMKASGAVLMGKLTTYELAHGGPSWDLPWPPAMNPWKPGYLPGNTSSGAGAAVAAGLLPAAIGSDTGGSVRMPAAVCGIVGVKPTYGLVSRSGVLPNTFSFDTCGPLTRTVEDAAIMLQAIAGFDDADITSVDRPVPDFCSEFNTPVRGLRIGWVKHWYDADERCHPDIPEAVATAVGEFEKAGAVVDEIELSSLLTYQDCKTTISITEMFSAYEREFRIRPQDFGEMYRRKVLPGALIRAEDYFQALRQRLRLSRELARAFREYDVLATAGWMDIAEPADPESLAPSLRPPNITTPFNVGGGPAMCLPCGFSREGLPLSLQLAADHFREPMLFGAGAHYQRVTDWHLKHPEPWGE